MEFLLLNTETKELIPKYIGYSVVFKNKNNNPQMETIIGYSISENTVSIKITNTRYPTTNRLNICKFCKEKEEWKNARSVYVIINR